VRKWIILTLCLGLLGSWSALAQERELDPLLKILVDKGVLSRAEAQVVQAEYDAQQVQEKVEIQETVQQTVKENPAKAEPPKGLAGVKYEGVVYLSYQNGSEWSGVPGEKSIYSQFRVKRGYMTLKKEIRPWLEARMTPDVHQDDTGDYKVRMKYAYAKFKWKGNEYFNKPYMEVGMVHMPWLDFEEHINMYRMQDTMFMERNGLFNSADLGLTVGSLFGPELDDAYQHDVSKYYPGKWGSWAVGIYNGGGYHAKEKNHNKVIEGRVTLRPLPNHLPGLQLSVFGVHGKGNVSEPAWPGEIPDWKVLATMLSYQHEWFVLSGTYYKGEGNQKGTAVDDEGKAADQKGYSFFTEIKFPEKKNWSFIGRYDRFDNDTDDPENDVQKRWIAGIAWHIYKHNTLLFDYESLDHRNPDIPNENRFQVTLQLKF